MNTNKLKVDEQRPNKQAIEKSPKKKTKKKTKKSNDEIATKKTEGGRPTSSDEILQDDDGRIPCYGCRIEHPSQKQHGCLTEPEIYKSTERDEALLREFGYDPFMYCYSGSGF